MFRTKTGKWLVGAATLVGATTLSASAANAFVERRIEYQQTTVYFSDNVSGGGALSASLTLASKTSNLNVFTATSGRYNSRLSTRCSNNQLLTGAPRNVTGTTAGDVSHTCPGNSFPIRIEGALDDL